MKKFQFLIRALFLLITGFLILTSYSNVNAQCPTGGITVITTDVTCNGFDDGQITIEINNANGYAGNYTYQIRDFTTLTPINFTTTATNHTFTGVAPEFYFARVISLDGGCSSILDPTLYQVDEPSVLNVTVDNITPACTAGTGEIEITASGGTPGYSYAWTGLTAIGDTDNPTGLDAGVYDVTVTDANGCTVDELGIVVSVASVPDASGTSTLSCDGTINLVGSTPLATETGTWTTSGSAAIASPNSPNTTATGLDAGNNTFTWTITDDNGVCPGKFDDVVVVWNDLQLTPTADVVLDCNGDSDATGTFTASGGTAPYGFTVDSNTSGASTSSTATTLDFTGGSVGLVTVTVTDADGCTDQATINITEPTILALTPTADVALSCNGDSDATGTFTASGGTAPYGFTVDSNTSGASTSSTATTLDFTGGSVGLVTVTVTDANGCTDQATINITEPATATTLTPTADVVLDCAGDSDATGTFTASGGTSPYGFTIDTNTSGASTSTTATTLDFTGGGVGAVTVTVTDANGCTDQATINITAPPALVLTPTADVVLDCNGDSDATGTFTASGGTAPYGFTVDSNTSGASTSTTATTLDFTGGSVGLVTVTVTDANGCTDQATINITEPTILALTPTADVALSCNGDSDATGTFTASGGTAPYGFTVDSNTSGASTSSTATTLDFTGGSVGLVTVTVTDANGCTDQATINITEPATATTLTPTADVVLDCAGDSDATGTFTASGGTSPYGFTIDTNTSGASTSTTATTLDFTGGGVGAVTVTVTDANGCTDQATINITAPPALVLTPTADVVLDCNGDSDATGTFTASGGTAPYGFTVDSNTSGASTSTTATTLDFTGGSVGLVTVTVTDANGCTDQATINITEPTILALTPTADVALSCNGDSDATGTFTASGGTAPYGFTVDSNTSGASTSSTATTLDFTGGSVGLVTVTVTDANGCTDQATINITEPATATTLTPTADVVLDCAGDSDATGTFTASGGTSPYGFTIDTNTSGASTSTTATTLDFTGGGVGAVTVTVTDANGCTDQATINITAPPALVLTPTADVVLDCNGDSDATGTFTASGGTAPYGFTVDSNTSGASTSTTATTLDFTGGSVGLVTVTVTDANGCTDQATINITEPTILALTPTADVALSCNGDSDATGTFTASGGTAPYGFTVDSNTSGASTSSTATTLDFTGGSVGLVTVTVTDANGCTDQATINITEPATATTLTPTADVVLDCAGDSDATGTFTASGGTSPYGFTIDTNTSGASTSTTATTLDFTGGGVGAVTVTVTDANGCTDQATINITAPPALVLTPTADVVLDCNGDSDATGTFTASGGTAPYGFTVDSNTSGASTSTTATTLEFTGGSVGLVTVTVTDANGCTDQATINITEPTILALTPTADVALSCNGDSDATGTFTASGGTAPYGFTVDSNTSGASTSSTATTFDFTGGSVGLVTVTVTDANGCTDQATINITEPTAISIVSVNVTDATCFGVDDGQLQVSSVTGGTTPYEFSIDNGANFQVSSIFNSLAAGDYDVQVRDANGCLSAAQVETVGSGVTISIDATNITTATCSGIDDGIIEVTTASGGTTPYEYSIDNGANFQISNTFNSLAAGDYDVQVRDANGCLSAAQVETVGSGVTISIDATNITTATCSGIDDGIIEVTTASGGTTPYEYSIDNGANFQVSNTFNGLAAGDYDVQVRDATGCLSAAQVETVGSGVTISIDATNITSATCSGIDDGIIEVTTVTGGTTPYEYSIDNGANFQVSNTFNGLAAGDYDVQVRDANGCLSVAQVETVGSGVTISIDATNITSATCSGIDDGIIEVTTVTGGTTPYEYSIDNGANFQVSSIFNSLAAGDYDVQVRDANGCLSASQIETVGSGVTISIDAVNAVSATCSGIDDGAIVVTTASGGTTPYEYSIDNGANFQVSNTFNGLAAGDYDVQVRDATGCLSAAQVETVGSGVTISIDATNITSATCSGIDDGIIEVTTVTGGTTPYEYSIDNGANFQVSNTFNSLAAGDYDVQVRDANGCLSAAQVETVGSGVTISIDATNITSATCSGIDDGIIEVTTVTGGTTPYEYSIDNGANFQVSNTFNSLAAGDYDVQVRDANGCLSAAQVETVGSGVTISIDATNITSATCSGIDDGIIEVTTVTGGTTPYEYSIDNGVNFQVSNTFNGLAAGDYDVQVRDANGCLSAAQVETVGSGLTISIDATNITSATCSGIDDGIIEVTTVTGGTTPYEYSIDNGVNFQVSNTFNSLAAGDYDVQVRDANGCLSASQIETVGSGLSISVTLADLNLTQPNCGDLTGGIIEVTTVTGGTTPYEYSIDNGANFQVSNIFNGLSGGSFDIQIRDANGCLSNVLTTNLTIPAGCGGGECATVVITPTPSPATCTNSDGSIFFDINPAVPTVNNTGVTIDITGPVSRTNLNNPTFTDLPIGTYAYTIEYGDPGCIKTGNVTIDQSGTVGVPVASDIVQPICFGSATGALTLDVSGETGNVLEYSLDGVSFTTFVAGSQITGIPAGPAPLFQRVISVRRNSSDPCNAAVTVVLENSSDEIDSGIDTTPLSTCDSSDGTITINATGGTGDGFEYAFLNSGGVISDSQYTDSDSRDGLPGGNYDIYIRDLTSECTLKETITVSSPGQLTINELAVSIQDASCSGPTDGRISMSIDFTNFVAPPYNLSILDQVNSTDTIYKHPVTWDGDTRTFPPNSEEGLVSGDYSVIVSSPTDGVCDAIFNFSITGGPTEVNFDTAYVQQQCISFGFDNSYFNQLVIEGISGETNNNDYFLTIVDINQSPQTISIQLQSGNSITMTPDSHPSIANFLQVPDRTYRLKLSQTQSVCSTVAQEFNYSEPINIPETVTPLLVTVSNITGDVPESSRNIGSFDIENITGGVSPYFATLEGGPAGFGGIGPDEVEFNAFNNRFTASYDGLELGDYNLFITDDLGCEISINVEIPRDSALFIPNIITPNNDGYNDFFIIRNLELVTVDQGAELIITSRWGKAIYSSSSYSNDFPWGGEDVPEGLYFYKLEAGGSVYSGWIEVVKGSSP